MYVQVYIMYVCILYTITHVHTCTCMYKYILCTYAYCTQLHICTCTFICTCTMYMYVLVYVLMYMYVHAWGLTNKIKGHGIICGFVKCLITCVLNSVSVAYIMIGGYNSSERLFPISVGRTLILYHQGY